MISETRKCLGSYTSLGVPNLTQKQDMEPAHQKLLDIPLGSPGTTTLRGNPPQASPVPPQRTTPAPSPRQTPIPSPRLTPTGPLGNAPVHHHNQYLNPRMTTSSRNQP